MGQGYVRITPAEGNFNTKPRLNGVWTRDIRALITRDHAGYRFPAWAAARQSALWIVPIEIACR
ncbi:Uncharacterized protein EbC_pEb17200880 (plasmid) [Erwinia billingiae Eb661]|uniref:Uncharacterized protein n=1 Tax=Erwinia billingiae (strain Eb661) TaxID=634500 RepID=D8MJU3_ERWBE|nr:Uncharacterized protein EbC_pEb17200880 [Erwinia billingiae Eb661]